INADAARGRGQVKAEDAQPAADAGVDAAGDPQVRDWVDVEAGGVDAEADGVLPADVAAEIHAEVGVGDPRNAEREEIDVRAGAPAIAAGLAEGEQIDALAADQLGQTGGQVSQSLDRLGRGTEDDAVTAQGPLDRGEVRADAGVGGVEQPAQLAPDA